MAWFKCYTVVLPIWAHKVSNWCSTSPHKIVWIYCRFVLVVSVTEVSSIILNFFFNNKNSYGSLLWKKAILNSYKFECSVVGSLYNLIFTLYFYAFVSFLLLLMKLETAPYEFVLHQCARFYYVKCSSS